MAFNGLKLILTNVKSGAALDLSGGDNRSIIAFKTHGGPNQQWRFDLVDEQEGIYNIQNVGSGKWITFPGPVENGSQVIGHDGPRPWRVEVGHEGVNVKEERESLRIFVPNTNYNIDLKGHGDGTDGNTVQLWERTPGKGQAWYFDHAEPQ